MKRKTVRDKSAEIAEQKPTNTYSLEICLRIQCETLSQAHVYAGRAGEAIEWLGATVAVKGEIVEIKVEENNPRIDYYHTNLSVTTSAQTEE